MEKKTFMQKLKNMGPAAIITSAFIGPGTITTATLVGVKFQYALLWAVVFSGIALIVLMEMSSRIAIASHKNVIDAAIALKPESRGWRLFVQISPASRSSLAMRSAPPPVCRISLVCPSGSPLSSSALSPLSPP